MLSVSFLRSVTAASRNGSEVSEYDQLVIPSCGGRVEHLKSQSTVAKFHHIGRFITSGCGLVSDTLPDSASTLSFAAWYASLKARRRKEQSESKRSLTPFFECQDKDTNLPRHSTELCVSVFIPSKAICLLKITREVRRWGESSYFEPPGLDNFWITSHSLDKGVVKHSHHLPCHVITPSLGVNMQPLPRARQTPRMHSGLATGDPMSRMRQISVLCLRRSINPRPCSRALYCCCLRCLFSGRKAKPLIRNCLSTNFSLSSAISEELVIWISWLLP